MRARFPICRYLVLGIELIVVAAAVISASSCVDSSGRPIFARTHPASGSSESTSSLTQPHSISRHRSESSLIRSQGSASNPPTGPVLAPFFGNLTTIASAAIDSVGLARQSDCSLTYYDFGFSATASAVSFDVNSKIAGYEKTIHNNAFLTTTPDQFPTGCVDNNLGISAQTFLLLGTGNNGQHLAASIVDSSGVYTGSLNSAQTSVTNPVLNATPIPAATMVSGSLRGNGKLDIVTVNTDGLQSSLTVFLSNGDGTYQAGVTYSVAASPAQFLAVGDFNHDGNVDVAVGVQTNPYTYVIFFGNGSGSLTLGPTITPTDLSLTTEASFIAADVNGDGYSDIVNDRGDVFLNNQNGTFTELPQLAFRPNNATPFGTTIVAADFNKDSKLDLAVDDGLTIRIFTGNGNGTFNIGAAYATIPNSTNLFATDLDGDGNMDLISGIAGNGGYAGDSDIPNAVYALMGNGDGTFQGARALPVTFSGMNLADLNGDGRPDLVGFSSDSSFNSTFTTLLAQSDGSYKPGPTLTLPPSNGFNVGSSSLVLGDFNGDHVADLLFLAGNPNTPGFYLALGNGDGSFQTPTFIAAPSFEAPGDVDVNPSIIQLLVADFNHDGKLDIAYNFMDDSFNTNVITEGFAVQLGNGNGTFQAPKIVTTYSSTNPPPVAFESMIGAIGDVNNDNFPDVFLVLPGSIVDFTLQHSVELLIGKGDGTFQAPSPVTLTGNINAYDPGIGNGFPIAFGDLNSDGKVDLIVGGSSVDGTTPQLAIALGNGNGTFQAPSILTPGGFGFVGAPAIGDFNGDGKLDVYADGIFYGNGNGTLQTIDNGDSTVSAPGEIALSVQGPAVATDVDGDEKTDLIVGDVVLLNKNGEVAPPPTLAPTTTTLNPSVNPAASGQSVTFTATVESNTPGTITGSVTFFDSNVSLGPAANLNGSGVASFTTSSLSTGSHSITAIYSGDSNFATSTSNVVTETISASTKAVTSTALISSQNPSTSGQSVTFTATVTSQTAGTPTGTATFFDGNSALGSAAALDGSSVATLTMSSLSAGSHSITAQYGGDANFATSTSAGVNQQVNASAAADFTVTAVPTTLNVIAGQPGTVVFTITPVNGSTQTVNFSCNGLPEEASCSFAPPSLTLDGVHQSTCRLTIQTGGSGNQLPPPSASLGSWPGNFELPILSTVSVLALVAMLLTLFAVVLFAAFPSTGSATVRFLSATLAPRNLRALSLWIAALALVTFAFVACAGGGGHRTPAGNYMINVTLSSGADSHTIPVTLTVTH